MHWIYLVFASIMEVCWIYSIKYLSISKIKQISWSEFFSSPEPFQTLLPLLGYIGFGIANIILFAMAMKGISASTAFGVWMGLALIGSKIIDVTYFGEPFSYKQIIFMGFILIGIIGLKGDAPS
ncbi:MAG: SMR family transporter [Bacteroidota bacterium]